MRIKSKLTGESAEVKPVPAAGIQDDVAWRCGHHVSYRAEERSGHAAIVQSPPSEDGCGRVARLLGSALLRLEQIDVSAPRDVKRMPARTKEPPPFARQWQMAAANRADEHAFDCSGDGNGVICDNEPSSFVKLYG
jgi:hypothetical protein